MQSDYQHMITISRFKLEYVFVRVLTGPDVLWTNDMQKDYGKTFHEMEFSMLWVVLFVLLDRYTKHCTVQQTFRRKLINKLLQHHVISRPMQSDRQP
jgi:hypothetical protein